MLIAADILTARHMLIAAQPHTYRRGDMKHLWIFRSGGALASAGAGWWAGMLALVVAVAGMLPKLGTWLANRSETARSAQLTADQERIATALIAERQSQTNAQTLSHVIEHVGKLEGKLETLQQEVNKLRQEKHDLLNKVNVTILQNVLLRQNNGRLHAIASELLAEKGWTPEAIRARLPEPLQETSAVPDPEEHA